MDFVDLRSDWQCCAILFLPLLSSICDLYPTHTSLTLSQTSPVFYCSAVQVFWKHCGKRRNCSFPQCFLPIWRTFYHSYQIQNCYLQTILVWKILKFVVWEGVNSLPNEKKFRPVQIERICRWQNKCDSKIELYFVKGRKHCEKRRKCWLPAFSPFRTMFSRDFLYRVV